MKRKAMILAAALLPLLVAQAGTQKATICTTYGDDIYDYQLDQMIDSVVPPSAKRLIVLTQCYGGDCLDNFTGTNTAVISATSSGQKAKYGGYDDDAANACKPEAGKTGQTVHDAGTAGKHPAETPKTGGGLAPGSVSLEPVTADGAVRSRHVIVYAGMPDKKGRDNAQRDKIKANFKGQLNTTVTTVGGEGPKDKWDKHGWKRGLQEAINEAAAAIEAAPDPSKEQFLLFVTDHGDMHNVEHVTTPAPPSNSVVVAKVAAFVAADFEQRVFERPGFSITVDIAPFTHEVGDPTAYTPFFPTNAWRILLTPPPPAAPVLLTGFEERFIEWDDGVIGNAPEEGVRLFFPADPALFVDSFFDITYDVEIFNDTPDPYLIMDFSQDTGPMAKDDSEPDFFPITEDLLVGGNDMILDGHDVLVDGCTLTIDGVHVLDRLTLTNNASVTHTAGAEGMLLTVCHAVSVASGSYIRANGRGAVKHAATTGRSGGSYGGRGQPETLSTSCPTFGDAFWPDDLGTGGSADGAGTTRGGGRIQVVADSFMLNGSVSVNGQDGPDYTGGGSGGSVLLDVGTLSGSGWIDANGGVKGNAARSGGGGRIAVYFGNGSGFDCSHIRCAGQADAGAGTIYLRNRGETAGELILDNLDRAHAETLPSVLSGDFAEVGRLTVCRQARLDMNATAALNLAVLAVTSATATVTCSAPGTNIVAATIIVEGTGRLQHGSGSVNGLQIACGSLTVGATALVNAAARGDVAHPSSTGRAGGSHGGLGTTWGFGSVTGPTYGDPLRPVALGTGGTRDGFSSSRGGGRIWIAADSILLNGSVTANGQNSPEYTGSGSGGSILIEVGTLSGSGSITANGGVPVNAGAGGGGRVAVYAQDSSGFMPSALSAKASADAGWGTVFMGIPRTVAVTCTGQGACDPAGPVSIPYGGWQPFMFNPLPSSLATNGTAVTPDMVFEWINSGLWRGTKDDAAWLALLTGQEALEAGFEALAAGQAVAQPGGGMAVTVNGLAGWRYTLERRESLTEGEWEPVTGQTEILCGGTGPLVLTDATVLPQAFYRVVSEAP